MTTYLGKSCSFCLPRVPFVNCRQFMYLVISLLVLRAGYGIWLYQFLIIAYRFTFHSYVSHEMNLKCMAAISHMSNITGLTGSVHKITWNKDNTKSYFCSRRPDLFHCYQLHLETSVVSEQWYMLTRGYAITYETNETDTYKTYETDV